ncbi:DUF697 domain-containing protein [Alteromonas pelagimontana]|uniref:DUF697 domain-containing protein n=1 Tax=Alteromonas pelagimontana TaxID=1858656 RepID=A0A6M4MFX9_9ALTE|nr:DUF697 domain-containing protein [Alteromonas pelagimontana]QJR81106.1 DUF697 domain-containing protein [Alteromonas pelagimontana]
MTTEREVSLERKYRSKIQQQPISEAPPNQQMPQKVESADWQLPESGGFSLKFATLGLGVLSFIAFSIFQAVDAMVANFSQYPITTLFLGILVGAFVACLLALIIREITGLMAVDKYIHERPDYQALEQADITTVRHALKRHASSFASHSFAAKCYRQFDHAVNSDLNSNEMLALYHTTVTQPVVRKAEEVMKRESLASGSLSFISPNNLIQTLVIFWISLRTIRRISLVFGLRPGTAGNWKLFKILAQNIAAYSLFDIATDEVANQISGSLSAKVMENSAEAVAAGALNMRLGKTLIRLLK